jgi:hypothetical protein
MPTFRLKSDGREYTTSNNAEVTRLRLSRAYEEVGVEPVPTVADERFHPGDHTVKEIQAYLDENPDDAPRVISEEKAGQARVSIVGG